MIKDSVKEGPSVLFPGFRTIECGLERIHSMAVSANQVFNELNQSLFTRNFRWVKLCPDFSSHAAATDRDQEWAGKAEN